MTGVKYSFDGKYIASSVGKTIALWNTTTGILQSTLEGHREEIRSMMFSCNGQLASCSSDGQVLTWEPLTGIICRKLQVPDDLWTSYSGGVRMAFAPDGTLAISDRSKAVYIWEPDRNTSLATVKPIFGVEGMTFLSRGKLALACRPEALSKKSEILLYDLGTKAERRILVPQFYRASFSSDDHVAITTDNGNIRVYDLTTGSHLSLRHSKDPIHSLTFSSSNKGVFAVFYYGSVCYWDLKTRLKSYLGTSLHVIRGMVSSPDSKLALAECGPSNDVWIWDVASPLLVQPTVASNLTRWGRRWVDTTNASSSGNTDISSSISSIVFSQDGHHLAAGSVNGTITLWNPATLRESRIIRSRGGYTYTISLSFHGNYLFSGGSYYARVWDTASRKLLQELDGPSSAYPVAEFLPNDEGLVIGGINGTMRIWNLKTWDLQHTLDVTGRLSSIAPSQDGRLIACLVLGGRNQEIQIWDTEQYKRLWNVQFHQSGTPIIEKIFFSVDNSYIATDRGHQIPLEQYAAAQYAAALSSESNMPVQRWKVEDEWLCHEGQNVLWLPPDFRPSCTAIYDDLFVIGHRSGKVTFFNSSTNDSTLDQAMLDPVVPRPAREYSSKARRRVFHWVKRAGKSKV